MKKKSSRRPKAKRSLKSMYLHVGPDGRAPKILRSYDEAFKVTSAYRDTLPDMMEAQGPGQGALAPIQQVGVSNFKMPLRIRSAGGRPVPVEASITGTVSLAAKLRGINMSRIVRSFYEHEKQVFSPATLGSILKQYRRVVGSEAARLSLSFSYPIRQRSLRSGLSGYQFYAVRFESTINPAGHVRTFLEFDFVYSSACPCSAELSEHARDVRGSYTVPHNQRSKARVKVEVTSNTRLAIEDLQKHCWQALRTETQVMVKREDEQAFAELNGAYLKFVEDAARLLYAELAKDARILDFQVACSHLESLHSHDAVSVICKGVKGGFTADFSDFRSLVC